MKETTNIRNEMRAAAKTTSALIMIPGMAMVILGTLAVLFAAAAGIAVTAFVGILLVAAGLFRIVTAVREDNWQTTVFRFLTGAVAGVAGIVLLLKPVIGLSALTLLVASYFLVDGATGVYCALRRRPVTGWNWLLAGGVVSLLLAGAIVTLWPLSSFWTIGLLIGFHLMFQGMSLTFFGATLGAGGLKPAAAR